MDFQKKIMVFQKKFLAQKNRKKKMSVTKIWDQRNTKKAPKKKKNVTKEPQKKDERNHFDLGRNTK